MTYIRDIKIEQKDNAELDAFGKRRSSSSFTFLDIKQTRDNLPLFIDSELNGAGASAVRNAGNAETLLATTSNGEYAVAQTFQRLPYLSGKSQDIKMTFSGFSKVTDVDKILGYYNSSSVSPFTAGFDGLMLWNDGVDVSLRIYKSGVLTSKINQSAWTDPLDGTGASGIAIDWSKSHIFDFDFQWLGVGRVRWNFNIDGLTVNILYSNHANDLAAVYMSSPNHSLRWELRQNGASAASFSYICATVETEGGDNHIGVPFGIDTEFDSISVPSVGTSYALLGLKLNAAGIGSHIDLSRISILAASNDRLRWELRFNPTIADVFTYADVVNTGLARAIGVTANTVTGGYIIACDYISKDSQISEAVESMLRLGTSIAGVADELVLCVTPISSNASCFGALNGHEIV